MNPKFLEIKSDRRGSKRRLGVILFYFFYKFDFLQELLKINLIIKMLNNWFSK